MRFRVAALLAALAIVSACANVSYAQRKTTQMTNGNDVTQNTQNTHIFYLTRKIYSKPCSSSPHASPARPLGLSSVVLTQRAVPPQNFVWGALVCRLNNLYLKELIHLLLPNLPLAQGWSPPNRTLLYHHCFADGDVEVLELHNAESTGGLICYRCLWECKPFSSGKSEAM